jgi:hypothetical protein
VPDELDHFRSLVERTDDRWLSDGYRRWLAGEPLDQALGLKGIDRGRIRRTYRDALLLRALVLVSDGPEGTWRRCVLLSREITRFHALFRAWVDLPTPPSRTSELRKVLWAAARIQALPGSDRGLYNAVRRIAED